MRTTMADPASAHGDIEPADDERAYEHGNPRQRRDQHNNSETTIEMETRVLIRGSSRRHVVRETTPTRDRVRL
jgi:hypothetical protein